MTSGSANNKRDQYKTIDNLAQYGHEYDCAAEQLATEQQFSVQSSNSFQYSINEL